MTLTAETTAENVEYMEMRWIDDTTGDVNSGWSYYDQRIEYSFYPTYSGEYTVQVYYSVDGRRSVPAEIHVTVTGTPHPSHGKVPINITDPEAILAGQDAVFALDYAAEGQCFDWRLDQQNEYGFSTIYGGDTLRNGDAITVPGYLLQAGMVYNVNISSYAADWYSNYRDYQFTVSANPDQPQAPMLALAEGETAYANIPVRFTVDEGWEKISLRYVGYSSSSWEEYNPNNLSFTYGTAETVQIYAIGLKNGVWSEESEPLALTLEEMPQVTEITPFAPSSMTWGEDLPITVLLPEGDGEIMISLDLPDGYSNVWSAYDECLSGCISASELLLHGIEISTYTVTYTWNHGDQTETVTRPLEVTGEVKTPITVSAEPTIAATGDTIVFSGETGDASRIECQFSWGWKSDNYTLDVTPHGSWSYSVIVPDDVSNLAASFAGYTSNGLLTSEIYGYNNFIYDTSLAAPSLQLLTENPSTEESVTLAAETTAENVEYMVMVWIDDTTGEAESGWNYNDQRIEYSFYPSYAGEYTVQAYYSIDGRLSAPAELHITVTGTPHPSHGKVPINITDPEAVLAGRDAVFALDYAAESQSFNWSLCQQTEYGFSRIYWGDTLEDGEGMTVPGYLLEAGTVYRLDINSWAEDWYSNYREYKFTVSANPDQPQAPALALAEGETAYTRIPVRFTVDEGWEKISLRYVGDDSSSSWDEYNPNDLSLHFDTADTVQVYARGLKNGVWSEVSEPLTLAVEELTQVTEIIPLTPSSIRWGEALGTSAIFPYGHGKFRVTINTPRMIDVFVDIYDSDEYSLGFSGSELINCGIEPGVYTVTYTWIHSGQTETVTRPLEVTGEVKAPVTVSTDHTSATAGDTIVFSGETGDASRIEGYIEWSNNGDWTSDNFTLNVTPGDSWSYSFTVPEGWTSLYASFNGYTSDDLYTGATNGEHHIDIYDASLAAPAIQLLTENPTSGQSIRASVEAPTEIEYWDVYWVNETAGGNSSPGSENTQRFEFDYSPTYAGEYTLHASYFANGGKRSAPAELHITVTGTPHPSHGNVPITFTAPEAILAGRDAVFALDYAAEGQYFCIDLYQEDENGNNTWLWTGWARDNQDCIVPGYNLDTDENYRLTINSWAEDWYSNYREYEFTVSANPDRPQPPVLALADEQAYVNMPISFTVDEGWETIEIQYQGDNIGSYGWMEFELDSISVTISEPDTVEFYVRGRKDGVWSEVTEPLTVTVEDFQVTEITPLTPSSIRWGEILPVSVWLPYDYGTITISINTSGNYSIRNDLYGNNYSNNIGAEELIAFGLTPGNYTVTYTWTDGSETETVTRPLEVTGEVKTPITVSTDHTSATAGDTIIFSGETGDASRIEGYIEWSNNGDWTSDNFTLNVTPGDSWSYSFTVPEGWTSLYASFNGYTSDDLYTGATNGEHHIDIYDASLAAPAIQLLTENPLTGQENRMSVEAPTEIEYWNVYYVDETTGISIYPASEDTQCFEFSFYPNYAGEYTVYASYFANGGKRSAPAELHITVTGTPHPSHGNVPIAFTIPESILAGQDTVFALDYAIDDQSFSWALWQENDNDPSVIYWGGILRDNQSLIVPGYVLEDSKTYRLLIDSEADDWYRNHLEYNFSVSANPNRPQPPVLALADEHAYAGIPFSLSVDEGWETIAIQFHGDSIGSTIDWQEYNPDDLSFSFPNPDTVEFYAIGLKNGVWSEVSEPLTVTVEEFQITEITPSTPESIRLGENLNMYALLPYNYGTIRVSINTPDPYSSYNYSLNGQREFDWYFDAGELIRAGLKPGSYTITFTWTDGQQTESVSCPLEVTGEAIVSPTITVNQTDVVPGDTIIFSGDTGSSDRIWLRIWFESDSSWNYQEAWLDVTPNSTWTYSLPAQNRAYCRARCEGFTAANLSVGTTWNTETRIHDDSMPLATVQLLTDNPTAGSDVIIHANTEADSFESWDIYFIDETTGFIKNRKYIYNQSSISVTFNPQYSGDYTMYASYVADGKMSAPTELHFTVAGTPHPSHGMVQMHMTAPETILAGQDATFNLEYFVEGQYYNYRLYEDRNGTRYTAFSGSVNNGAPIVLPGFCLEEQTNYSLFVESGADDWFNNQTNYDFIPAENPNRPQPPVLTKSDGEVYLGLPIHYSVDDGWEEIAMGASIVRENQLVNNGYVTWTRRDVTNLCEDYINGVSHVTVYAKGLKNGVWSKASQPVEFDVIDGPKLGQVQIVSAPEQLTVGQPFTVVLAPLENAELYVLELYYDNNSRLTRVGNAMVSSQPVLTFDSWNDFESEGNYQIVVHARAEGYNHYPSENRINRTGIKAAPVAERVYTLPSALKEIDEEAFSGSNATVIVIPDGCQSIGVKAFAGCNSLTRVVIPASVTSIAGDAFDGCGTLTIVTSQGSAAYDMAVAKGYTIELTN